MSSTIAIVAISMLANSAPAFAYLDPGTGSYILQVAIGLVAGAIFMIRNYWVVIKGYCSKLFNKNKKD
jgi:hypothetical protein